MSFIERLHEQYIITRRARVLSARLAAAIPSGPQRVLDIGCGDGRIGALLQRARPELKVHGVEIRDREGVGAPPQLYDGRRLPFDAHEVDVVLLADVLHHAENPRELLADAVRVAALAVIVKDHLLEGPFAGARLRFMDRVGNRRFGVPLPYNYWTRAEWTAAFHKLRIEPDIWTESLGLYPWPLRPIFDGLLHFIARCPVTRGGRSTCLQGASFQPTSGFSPAQLISALD